MSAQRTTHAPETPNMLPMIWYANIDGDQPVSDLLSFKPEAEPWPDPTMLPPPKSDQVRVRITIERVSPNAR